LHGRRHLDDFKGPKTLEQWIDVYERRAGDDVHYQLEDGEHLYFSPEHGFFTWRICENHPGWISIPKMCGDGKFLRHVVWDFVKHLERFGINSVLLCSRHRPEVYCRIIGGRWDHTDYTVNLNTGRREPLYFYVVTLDDTKEGDAKCDTSISSSSKAEVA
jgi:hypothetical protein